MAMLPRVQTPTDAADRSPRQATRARAGGRRCAPPLRALDAPRVRRGRPRGPLTRPRHAQRASPVSRVEPAGPCAESASGLAAARAPAALRHRRTGQQPVAWRVAFGSLRRTGNDLLAAHTPTDPPARHLVAVAVPASQDPELPRSGPCRRGHPPHANPPPPDP